MKFRKIAATTLLILGLTWIVKAENTAKWIYYPGDFEIWLTKKVDLNRTERNQSYPPMWRLDAPYGTVTFHKQINLKKPERASIYVDGKYFIRAVNNQIMYDYNPHDFELAAGNYTLSVYVENYNTVPSILFSSPSYKSDESWITKSFNDDNFNASVYNSENPSLPPSSYKLNTEPMEGKKIEETKDYTLYDFGRNTFGFPVIQSISGKGKINLYYGESKQEAMAGKLAETWDELNVNNQKSINDTLATKAFRYIKVTNDSTVKYKNISMLYEYLPVKYRGNFTCSDESINQIYQTALYTLQLTTRECHIDGIKRDRWVWSGDALQSYMMNFYTFFDENVNKNTLWGLRGHSPVNKHINTILDYSFYWMIGVDYHYLYTGDKTFVTQIYPRMKETMDFCLKRLNKNGMVEGKDGDWVFIDWAKMDKKGEISFEQLLFMKSILSVKNCAQLAKDVATMNQMQEMYDKLHNQFEKTYWSDEKEAFLHNSFDGKPTKTVTRYTNMFAILYDMIDSKRKDKIKNSVLLNDSILGITTPYMKFYELAALCEIGEQAKVLQFVKSYWGGMLKLGATTFWETFNPKLEDSKHYEMYNRPYGKSLCHAWGANPVYLFGRYFLGVYPTLPGYKEYKIEPNLGGLKNMEGAVPTPVGDIKLKMNERQIIVSTPNSNSGKLIITSKSKPVCKNLQFEKIDTNKYSALLTEPNKTYEINYRN